MKFLIFLGTTRDSTPPKPARLGLRVAKACIDALDYPLESVFKPYFSYASSKAPTALSALAEKIESADGFVMISPEYNHSMSPALSNLLNHFGSSLFSYKPSAIVTYSAGQWGGMRAAIGMRTFLSELGCLSVSAMIHIPKAQEVLTEDGAIATHEDQRAWFNYFGRTFYQLDWWAQATKNQRDKIDPHNRMSDFKKDPSQRNAP
ncbi:NADPH-dependent FMN reductase [Colwellia sp. 20A7]|uniref:NADPH-dependent FMN reductase n=1 Tax=Colwellia sp. 20A7 TaxID=2689569 RepID=UPI00135BE850|nr:NAD(P)H-dependent oxidoreductase [Colwellia sp. 20A7]